MDQNVQQIMAVIKAGLKSKLQVCAAQKCPKTAIKRGKHLCQLGNNTNQKLQNIAVI
ncbi:hypothetical protein [Kiloniella majae]|uniref:hypothetical protein n=1 Tax=Kiloniella majae TaxID=1938558 RepID=UPI001C3FDBA2|nr:hypothetical protein [Kiloniella majae]